MNGLYFSPEKVVSHANRSFGIRRISCFPCFYQISPFERCLKDQTDRCDSLNQGGWFAEIVTWILCIVLVQFFAIWCSLVGWMILKDIFFTIPMGSFTPIVTISYKRDYFPNNNRN